MRMWFCVLLCYASLQGVALAKVSVRDDEGSQITLARPAQRIISLAPHATEDLFAIGAGGLIVGAVNYSDYPEAAKSIPRVGGYNGFDLEKIRALRPDLIVAWGSGNPERQLAQLRSLGIPMFVTFSRKLEDVPTVMERLGVLTGKQAGAAQAAARFRTKLAQLRTIYAKRLPVRVYYQIWDRPLMTINDQQIISDVMRLCGGVNVFGKLPDLTPKIDVEAVLAANPDVIMTSAEPGVEKDWLQAWRQWRTLKAAQTGQFYTLPRDAINRMGPRLVDGVEAMCVALDKVRAAQR